MRDRDQGSGIGLALTLFLFIFVVLVPFVVERGLDSCLRRNDMQPFGPAHHRLCDPRRLLRLEAVLLSASRRLCAN